ncbi:tyrosinase [Geosmithia morbida]|uniref:Tyrosinase n=1 Tax=Geosmithia morbida TaxID=1094350 RepID=A0A9P4YYF2_9HYPO|nr:tyrosinase [Geosmithia morbida]KAF4124345.1 tyrosinase [Geosmithia morbida]
MGHSIPFICLIAILVVLSNAQVSFAHESREEQMAKCDRLLIRKEWRTLEDGEKAEWVGAVKCLASIRHQRLSLSRDQSVLDGKRSLYDDFSYSHASLENSTHRNAYFLPWRTSTSMPLMSASKELRMHLHMYMYDTYRKTDRWFTHLFDSSLRRTCGYTGPTPYWDWSRDHANLFASPVFDDSPEQGLGGTGDCESSDCTVTTGALTGDDFQLAWPIPHSLRRNLTLITGWYPDERPQNETLGPETVCHAIDSTTGDFFTFQRAMSALHNHVHNFVGGDLAGDCPGTLPEEDCQDMAMSFTPNDPLFWLHHAQLDRLWNVWQRQHPSNFAAFSGMPLVPHNMTDPHYDADARVLVDEPMFFDVQSVPVAPRTLFDIETWPLCYRYAEEEEWGGDT